jgi:hypothetical protein
MHTAVEPPAPWNCLEDRLTAFLESHPDYDLDDAIEALIWGYGETEESPDE